MKKVSIGVDVGGTNIKIGLVNVQGKNVIGIFMEMTTSGIRGSGNTTLYGVRLIE